MPTALIDLLLLQGKAFLRRVTRGLRTPRGAIFFVVGLLMVAAWLASVTLTARGPRAGPEHVRVVIPIMLLGICLLTALTSTNDRAIAFTPGEVDFLFPGPFTRRQLIFYKLAKSTLGAALTAIILSLALRHHGTLWIACYLGALLAMLFIQFFSTVLVLAGQTVSEAAWSRGRRIVLLGIAVAAVLGGRDLMARHGVAGPRDFDAQVAMRTFSNSQFGKVVLMPFDVFGQAFTAERVFPDLLKWGAIAAAIDVGLLALIVRLDRNYLEAALGASQRRHARLQRVRGGGAMAATAGGTSRRRLIDPPFLGGVGPIAWRQIANAGRSARGLLFVLILLAVILGPFMVASKQGDGPGGRGAPHAALFALLSAIGGFSVILASLLRFDFRADLDAMDTLKALPLRPWTVAAGQLVAPVLVMTAIHWTLLIAVQFTMVIPANGRGALAVAASLVIPFNALLFAAENLIFLLAPSRPTAAGPGDFQLLGRQFFTLAMRTILVVIGATLAAGIGALAYLFSDRSLAVLTIATATVLIGEIGLLIPLIGWAFRRFDPSLHTPA